MPEYDCPCPFQFMRAVETLFQSIPDRDSDVRREFALTSSRKYLETLRSVYYQTFEYDRSKRYIYSVQIPIDADITWRNEHAHKAFYLIIQHLRSLYPLWIDIAFIMDLDIDFFLYWRHRVYVLSH